MVKRNLRRKDLSNKIHQNIGFSKNLSSLIVDDFFKLITNMLIKSKKVKISDFGTFNILEKSERIGRNPKTKVEKLISSRKVVTFKASKKIKNKLNKS